MGSVNFYLKAAEKSTGKSLIYLQFKFNGRRLVYAFGQRILPSNWNATKQRVKSNKATTEDGQFSLNDLLGNLEVECLKSYNKHLKEGSLSPDLIKEDLNLFMNRNSGVDEGPTLYALIDRFISGEIKYKGRNKTKGTLKIYGQTLRHLKDFS